MAISKRLSLKPSLFFSKSATSSRFYFEGLALRLRYRCSFFSIVFDDCDLGDRSSLSKN